ncbi:MAG: hypothetical protein IPM42_15905 [Saprospiraceae bacterium]|nr:hypothetical protein [Saprospiraceae bacterium]
MDTKRKEVKGKDNTAIQVKNEKNKEMPAKKSTDAKSDDKKSDKKGEMKKAGAKKTATTAK